MKSSERGTGKLLAEMAADAERLRRMKPKRKTKSAKKQKSLKRVGVTYQQRAKALRRLGFDSYEDYLRSEMWAGVRQKAIERHGRACVICRSEYRIEMHHNRYDYDTLVGASLRFVVPLCCDCHETVEFQHGNKVLMGQAIRRFYALVGERGIPVTGRTWQ